MMKARYISTVAIAVMISLTGCNSDKKKAQEESSLPPVAIELAQLEGSWSLSRTGHWLSLSAEGVTRYHITSESCLEELSLDPEGAAEYFTSLKSEDVTQNFSFLEPESAEYFRETYLKQDALPSTCDNAFSSDEFNPERVFDHIWQTFAEYYPFLSDQDVDWPNLYQEYVTQVHSQMSEAELFEIITEMLSSFEDPHISLSVDSDNLSEDFSTESLSTYLEYALERAIEDNGDDVTSYYIELITEFTQRLEQAYGQTDFQHHVYADAINVMTWGELAGNIGYLQINAMQYFSDTEEATDIDEIDAAIAALKLALADLASTEKLIVDIRFNRGGYDPISLAFASHFSEQEDVAYNRQVNGRALKPEYFIAEHSKTYQKPIDLIINDGTQSGAEVFALAMSELANVTIYGEESAGHLANMMDVYLAPDWELSLSNEVIKAADGSDVEGLGIIPEHSTDTNNITEHQQGIFSTIETILNQ